MTSLTEFEIKNIGWQLGKNVGLYDCIEVWWQPNRDTIVEIKDYNGPLSYLFPEGAKIAIFALNKVGMTIDNAAMYKIISKGYV